MGDWTCGCCARIAGGIAVAAARNCALTPPDGGLIDLPIAPATCEGVDPRLSIDGTLSAGSGYSSSFDSWTPDACEFGGGASEP